MAVSLFIQREENARGIMREPIQVLNELSKQSRKENYHYQRLYRNLYNPQFYLQAYQNIYSNKGSLTKGADGITLDGFSQIRIDRLIESIKNHSYRPAPARRTYIAKKNSNKKRPLGIASGNDKLVQEVVRMILESIYEPTFSNSSHGFRPNRSSHTALLQIKSIFTGTKWFVEGDIKACFDSFNHQTLIQILRKRIKDEAFIELVWKMLKAGYMENWEYMDSYSGVPQGSGCSPILCNIYMNELDRYVEQLAKELDTREHRKKVTNPEYGRICARIQRMRKHNQAEWETLRKDEKKERSKELKKLLNRQLEITPQLEKEGGRKWLAYVRYADDFLIGIGGSKADANEVKEKLADFLDKELGLTLSMEKTQITHTSQRAKFLGYEIAVLRDKNTKKRKDGRRSRVYWGKVRLYVPHEKWEKKLKEYGAIKVMKHKDGTERWRAMPRKNLAVKSAAQIVSRYNAELRGMYNYYAIANNVSVLGKMGGLMKYSMLKTLGTKYRVQVSQIRKKYQRGKDIVVPYRTQSGIKEITFYNKGFRKQNYADKYVADYPTTMGKYAYQKNVISRFKSCYCELCGKADKNIEIHQIRKMSDLTGKEEWEQVMITKRRKTLIVCRACHEKIHNGKIELAID